MSHYVSLNLIKIRLNQISWCSLFSPLKSTALTSHLKLCGPSSHKGPAYIIIYGSNQLKLQLDMELFWTMYNVLYFTRILSILKHWFILDVRLAFGNPRAMRLPWGPCNFPCIMLCQFSLSKSEKQDVQLKMYLKMKNLLF